MQPAVYMMSNQNNNVLYIGVTSNLVQRVYQHRNHLIDGFSKQYNVSKLVYFEIHEDMSEAIKREKALKNWHRDWKNRLVFLDDVHSRYEMPDQVRHDGNKVRNDAGGGGFVWCYNQWTFFEGCLDENVNFKNR
jgi:putative endonuclease